MVHANVFSYLAELHPSSVGFKRVEGNIDMQGPFIFIISRYVKVSCLICNQKTHPF
jgi:hypothetical protein